MQVSDERLALWARPLSDSEDARCISAREQITEAVRNKFGNDVRVFLQGSYANGTNVRQDSDIDVVVVHTGYHFPDVTFLSEPDKTQYWANFQPAKDYNYKQFRDEVHAALSKVFPGMLDPKEKCIKVRGTSTRMQADVVPAFEHHRMSTTSRVECVGIEFRTLSDTKIESFPEQHYANGVDKNTRTSRSYKQVVRILKNIRNVLEESGALKTDLVSSHFIECLVYNVPDSYFNDASLRSVAREVTAKIWNDMQDAAIGNEYLEVSNLHWLFKGQSRTRAQASDFTKQAWNYLAP